MTTEAGWINIESGYFDARLRVERGVVIRATPMVSYMVGWYPHSIHDHCVKKNWTYTYEGE